MGTPPFFSAMFSKGDNFCEFLAYLEDKVFPKWGLLVKERICSSGSRFFPYIGVFPVYMGGNSENDILDVGASPESVPIHLNGKNKITEGADLFLLK